MRLFIKVFILAMAVVIILVEMLDSGAMIMSCGLVTLWSLAFLELNMCKNIRLYACLAAASGAFLSVCWGLQSYVTLFVPVEVIAFGFLLLYRCYRDYFDRGNVPYRADKCLKDAKNGEAGALFPEHQRDFERILDYLNREGHFILGIEAAWGNGKSYVVDRLKEKLKMEGIQGKFCELIEIDVLATNIDNVYEFLLKSIEEALRRNGVFSIYAGRLRKILAGDHRAGALFALAGQSDFSYTTALKGVKDEIEKLDRIIVIVYEDIDRIENQELIKKIFYISEKLSGPNVRVVYEYDADRLNLRDMDEFYTDKYIPHTIHLTQISFIKLLKYLRKCSTGSDSETCLTDGDLRDLQFAQFKLMNELPIRRETLRSLWNQVFSPRISIRAATHFLQEVEMNAGIWKTIGQSRAKRVTIAFSFIHFFMPEIFALIRQGGNLLDVLKIQYRGKLWLPNEFCWELSRVARQWSGDSPANGNLKEEWEAITGVLFGEGNEVNFLKCVAFFLLELNEALQTNRSADHSEGKEQEATREQFWARESIALSEVVRLLGHLMQAGSPETNDYKMFADELSKKIKGKPVNVAKRILEEMESELFKDEKNYRTIFTIDLGVDTKWLRIFQAYDVAAEAWSVDERILRFRDLEELFFYQNRENQGEKVCDADVSALRFWMESIQAYRMEAVFDLLLDRMKNVKFCVTPKREELYWGFYGKVAQTICAFGYSEARLASEFRGKDQSLELIRRTKEEIKKLKDFFAGAKECPETGVKIIEKCDKYIAFLERMGTEGDRCKSCFAKRCVGHGSEASGLVDMDFDEIVNAPVEQLQVLVDDCNLTPVQLCRALKVRQNERQR